MIENDPFLDFIKDNPCEHDGCGFTGPGLHTHKLFNLHNSIAPQTCECGKNLKHWWTAHMYSFLHDQSGYMSNFVCGYMGCEYTFRILTPIHGMDNVQEEPWLKIVKMTGKNET